MKNNILAGIDPDVYKSGFALIHGERVEITTLSFFDVFKSFKQLITEHGTKVYPFTLNVVI